MIGGGKIAQLPKLIIKNFGYTVVDTLELDQAEHVLNFIDQMVMVEGKRAKSYDELVNLVSQEKYRDKEFIDVVLLPAIAGG
jgi:PDZ domain-containing secreted protein